MLILLIACAGPGCRPSKTENKAAGPVWFEEVTAQSGLNFTHDAGTLGRFFMPETVGSGAALFDYDNDGRLDICLIQNGARNLPP